RFYEYIRRFGFGERPGIELPGEISGVIRPPKAWSKISITRIPMGHEVGVTPLQMTGAMAVIANGGKLVTPRIIKSITTPEGKTVSSLSPVVLRQVISPETAREIGDALRGVVSARGNAPAAASRASAPPLPPLPSPVLRLRAKPEPRRRSILEADTSRGSMLFLSPAICWPTTPHLSVW